MKLRTHTWNQLRSPEIAEARNAGAVVLIPTGATEQHGAHLPLDTDILSATTVSLRAAELVEEVPVLVANVLHVGFSPHHLAHPGTLSLRLETFVAVLTDVVKNIWSYGFRRILIVNGHGGNIAPLISVGNQLTTDGMPVAVCSYWDFTNQEREDVLEGSRKSVGHACEFETSILLHLRPEAVNQPAAVRDFRPPWNPRLDQDVLTEAGVAFPPVFRAESTGVLGDPTLATADKGQIFIEAASRKLANFIQLFQQTDIGE